jgi:hypothetical protein
MYKPLVAVSNISKNGDPLRKFILASNILFNFIALSFHQKHTSTFSSSSIIVKLESCCRLSRYKFNSSTALRSSHRAKVSFALPA